MDAERTVHGPFRFTYVRATRVLQLIFLRVQRMYMYLSRISNSASRLLVCNREVERDPVYYERGERNRSKKYAKRSVRLSVRVMLACVRVM